MILIIGGAFQAKLDYVLQNFGYDKDEVADGSLYPAENIFNYKVINNFHLIIRRNYETCACSAKLIDELFANGKTEVIIANEVGLGVVPLGENERALRDYIGKTLAEIAKRAENVTRVSCGLGLKIK